MDVETSVVGNSSKSVIFGVHQNKSMVGVCEDRPMCK